MARREIRKLVDDIDGSDACRTVEFVVDGTTYEIDLSEENLDKFTSSMTPWVSAARRTGATARRAHRNTNSTKIREWARSMGIEVPPRGPVPTSVRDAYRQAHA